MKFSVALTILLLTISSATLFAQDTAKHQAKTSMQQTGKTKYTCPMHPSVTSNKPGKCAKCGMELVKAETPAKKTYVCPMHPDVTRSKPGKCPKCKMALVVRDNVQN